MDKKTSELSIPLDDEGYVSLTCPYCHERFKLKGNDFNDESIYELFCPYCGLKAFPKEFYTDDVIDQVKVIGKNYAVDAINQFTKDLERIFKNTDNVTFTRGREIEKENLKEMIEPPDLQIQYLKCCKREIKIFKTTNLVYCPFCGGISNGDKNR